MALASTPALAVYKCEAAGSTTYSDLPCPGGKRLEVADPVSATEAARAGQRAKQQHDALGRIDAERRKTGAQDLKKRTQLARAEASHTKKCAQLALRKKSAEDGIATASKRAMVKARGKARRTADQYELQCGKAVTPALQKLS